MIPTLGEYAELIEWLVTNPNEEVPKRLRPLLDDALNRAGLRRFAAAMELTMTDWQFDYLHGVQVRGPSADLVVLDEVHDWEGDDVEGR